MCMITRCWSFWCLHFSFTEKHHKKREKRGSYMSTTLLHLFTQQQQEDRPGTRSWRANNWWMVWPPIPGRLVDSAEEIIALVWNGHSAFIWVNGAEGEIFSRSLALCQHVEKRWLPENENSCEADPSGPDGVVLGRRSDLSNTVPPSAQAETCLCGDSEQNIWTFKSKTLCPITRSDNPIIDQLHIEARGKLPFLIDLSC